MNRCLLVGRAVLLSGLIACGGDATGLVPNGPVVTSPTTPAATRPVSSLTVESSVPFVLIGRSIALLAKALDTNGSPTAIPITWTVSNSSIASVETECRYSRCDIAHLTPYQDGVVTVTVAAGGRTASLAITTIVNPPVMTAVVIDSFSVEEITAPRGDEWYYVPSMRLREPSGAQSDDVIGMSLTFPLGQSPLRPLVLCGRGTPIGAGRSINIFDLAGTGRLAFSASFDIWDEGSIRAGPGDVTAIVYVRDASGSVSAARASGPIMPASAATAGSHTLPNETPSWLTGCE